MIFSVFLPIIQSLVVCLVHIEPIRVGRIDDLAPIVLQDSPLKQQADRLESLRRKLSERSRVREEELAEAARQYKGSKLFQENQRILARLHDE